MTKYTKYVETVPCNQVARIAYWQELERKNEVQLTPIITEDAVMVFAPDTAGDV